MVNKKLIDMFKSFIMVFLQYSNVVLLPIFQWFNLQNPHVIFHTSLFEIIFSKN
jgi:hypothetical protein